MSNAPARCRMTPTGPNVVCDVISLVLSNIAAIVIAQIILGAIGRVDVEVPSVPPSRDDAGGISAQHATACSREYVMDVARTKANWARPPQPQPTR